MKRTHKIGLYLLCLLAWALVHSQVGIGTLQPEGMLDMQKNNFNGFVFPKAALTSTSIASPVINPKGGSLIAGTAIYNTNTVNDVTPGIYLWNGSKWIPQYRREDHQVFEQTPLDQRIALGSKDYNKPTSDWVYVSGLEMGHTFTPNYTGTYKIRVNQQFGAGKVLDTVAPNKTVMATEEGLFRFKFNGTNYLTYSHSYSMYTANVTGGKYYEAFPHDTQLTLYLYLTAGTAYSFSLEFDMFIGGSEFDNPETGDGRGHVGIDKPCTIEFTLLE